MHARDGQYKQQGMQLFGMRGEICFLTSASGNERATCPPIRISIVWRIINRCKLSTNCPPHKGSHRIGA